ncbi:hypothetical protein FS749_010013 [Ceratobasidium sp. UAMH 11750]|nr:hypothetical protein FS749_010013 [Ceratobasidium sp. UAMH 11750]
MPPRASTTVKKSTKYSSRLQEFADDQAQRLSHQLDADELASGRNLKKVFDSVRHQRSLTQNDYFSQRKRVTAKLPNRGTGVGQPPTSNPVVPPGYGAAANVNSRPGPAAGPSQNVNGSEAQGHQARDTFVKKTINAAAAIENLDAAGTNTGVIQQPIATNNPPPSGAGPSTGGPPPATSKPVVDEDADMQYASDDPDSDEKLEQGATSSLSRLKAFCKDRPTEEMKKALYSMLKELSEEAEDTDTEQEEELPKRRKGGRRKSHWVQDEEFFCTDNPRRRDKRRVALSGYLRLVTDELLGVSSTDPLPAGPPPEVAAPTAAAFYIKWDESEKSDFNATAARIVSLRVVDDWPSLFDLDDVFDMVTSHFKYLRTRYRRQTVPEVTAKEPQRHRSQNANTRKHTLYRHRLSIINTIPALAKHGRLFESLGLDGTSSDEESPRKGIYIVRRKKQLSSKVQNLKRDRQLDQAYAIHFKGPGSKGNQLRQRIDTGVVSTRNFRITGLPLSCIDQAWLATITDVQKGMLDINEDLQYDFTFPEELLEVPP